jgi:hypothetical protein
MGLLYFIYPTGCFSELNLFIFNKELGQSFVLIMCYKIKEIERQDIVKKLFSLKPKKKKN